MPDLLLPSNASSMLMPEHYARGGHDLDSAVSGITTAHLNTSRNKQKKSAKEIIMHPARAKPLAVASASLNPQYSHFHPSADALAMLSEQ
ncbi:unnamed protein product [Phytophthora fragariaefolia]|uniref:Unnamed protein product n=1 Tax=Phytophthora fragariaefolia TaxID=1490495 RepID=A0A9W6XWX7_9STRA|nr:unnamed protein product [Phytophthora fragariaefolia]